MAKKYSINMEGDKIISVEVDGKKYANPDQIPDPEDRARVEMFTFSSTDMDFDQPPGQSSGFPKIILPLFLAIAVLMLAISGLAAVITGRAIAKEVSAPGHVVDYVTRTDSEGQEFYYPVVQFYLPDQSRQRVELSEGSWPPTYQRGEPVTVLYDPDRPLNARIKSVASTVLRWTLSIITGILGLAFLGATLFARWILKSD